ncbi:MAG: hypothetical protein AAGE01_26240, partial [Pseudomonadota bacterium]
RCSNTSIPWRGRSNCSNMKALENKLIPIQKTKLTIMSTFHSDNSLGEMTFHGARELSLDGLLSDAAAQCLARWRHREDATDSAAELFDLDKAPSFVISYDGKSGHYRPDQPMNAVPETIIREFLYGDGICSLTDMEVRAFAADYSVITEDAIEYLLVCPFPTEAGNVGGLVVVCLNHQRK